MFTLIGFGVVAALVLGVAALVYAHYHASKTKTLAVKVANLETTVAAQVAPLVAEDASKVKAAL